MFLLLLDYFIIEAPNMFAPLQPILHKPDRVIIQNLFNGSFLADLRTATPFITT